MVPAHTPSSEDCPKFDGWLQVTDLRIGQEIWTSPSGGCKGKPSTGWLITVSEIEGAHKGDLFGLLLMNPEDLEPADIANGEKYWRINVASDGGMSINWHYHRKEA